MNCLYLSSNSSNLPITLSNGININCLCTNSSYGFPSKTKDANNAVTFSIDSNGEVSISCSTYTSKTYKIMLSSINATYSEIDETESSSYYYVVKTLEEKDEEEGRKDEESNC